MAKKNHGKLKAVRTQLLVTALQTECERAILAQPVTIIVSAQSPQIVTLTCKSSNYKSQVTWKNISPVEIN